MNQITVLNYALVQHSKSRLLLKTVEFKVKSIYKKQWVKPIVVMWVLLIMYTIYPFTFSKRLLHTWDPLTQTREVQEHYGVNFNNNYYSLYQK